MLFIFSNGVFALGDNVSDIEENKNVNNISMIGKTTSIALKIKKETEGINGGLLGLFTTDQSVDNTDPISVLDIEEEKSEEELEKEKYLKVIYEGLKLDGSLSETIVTECMENAGDVKVCIKNVIGISTAESSLFKNCNLNNCFGLMGYRRGKIYLRSFDSKEDSICGFMELYRKNKWWNRKTGKIWLERKYCALACGNWLKNYNGNILLLKF